MSLFNYSKQKKKLITEALAASFVVAFVFAAILPKVFAATAYYFPNAAVELNGTDDGAVTISLNTPIADSIYSIEGNFQTSDESGNFVLTTLTPAGGITPSSNVVSDGRVLWQDATWENPLVLDERESMWSATYTVDKDTPADDYSVCLTRARIASDSNDFDTHNYGNICATVTVTRSGAPATKPSQVVTFRDGSGNPVTGLTQWYGDADITITKEVTTGDGAILEYHPDDDGTGSIAHTDPVGDTVGFGEPGSVDICAWVAETETYAATKACYTVEVTKRPIGVSGATITDKTYDGTRDAQVTAVSFSNPGNGTPPTYTAEGTFATADAGADKAIRVDVTLTGDAVNHYDLSPAYLNTTKTISPFTLTVDDVEFASGSDQYTYDPDGVEPGITVTADVRSGTSTLVLDADYEVEYVNNTAVGQGQALISGKGNYTTGVLPIVMPFDINAQGITNEDVEVPSSIVEGRILEADDVSVVVNGHTLTRCATDGETNCDYVLTISGDNDGEVGHTVTVAVNGRNNYGGAGTAEVSIVAKLAQTVTFGGDVTNTTVNKSYGDADFTYVATSDGDGGISYRSTNESVATVDANGKVSIIGIGDADIYATASETATYAEGSAKYTVSVGKKAISVTGATVASKAYDGTPVATVSDVTLSESSLVYNTDFTATGLFNGVTPAIRNVNVMVALTAAAYEHYCFPYESSCLQNTQYAGIGTITPFDLNGDTATAVLADESLVFTGSERCTTATVKADLDGNGVAEAVLTAGTDYDIVCSNNVNVGTADVTITGKGNYSGSLSDLHFTITAAPVENVVVTAPAQDYTGEALEPVPTVTGEINGVSQTFNADDYTIIAHADFINAGDYTFSVKSVTGGNYYFNSTDGIFTINKVSSGMPPESSQNLRIEAGSTLADLGDRSSGFAWTHPDDTVSVGTNSYSASYIRNNDATNYIPTVTTVTVYGLTRINILTASNDGGEVVTPGGSALEGDELVWTITPDDGYEVLHFSVNLEEKTGEISDGRFTMIAGKDDITAILTFRRVYEFIAGMGQTHIRGVDGVAEFEIDADYELFEESDRVYVDDEQLDEDKYRTWSGSTMIELSAEYLDSLEPGEHTLAAVFSDGGIARTTFIIADPEAPEEETPAAADTGMFTGETSGALATGASVMIAATLSGVVFFAIKSRKED